jgi:hypothetical protein
MVEEKSKGRLKITIYPGSTLGKAVDHFDMVKDGVADLGFTTPGYTPERFPLHGDRAAAAVQVLPRRQPGRHVDLRPVLQARVQGREGPVVLGAPP